MEQQQPLPPLSTSAASTANPTSATNSSNSNGRPSTLVRLRDLCIMLFTVGDRLRDAYRVPSKEPVRNENIRQSQTYIRAFVVGAGSLLVLDLLRRYEPSLLTF